MWSIVFSVAGEAFKALLSFFLPSKDERLGKAEQQVKDENAVIQAIQQKQKIDQDVAGLSDATIDQQLRDNKWTRDN